jgi:hypothetical protein
MENRIDKSRWLVIGLLLISVAIIFIPILYEVIFKVGSDYSAHIQFAKEMRAKGVPVRPHFFYQLVVIFFQKVFEWKGVRFHHYLWAGFSAALVFYLSLALILYFVISQNFGASLKEKILNFFLSLSLMMVAPIPLLAGLDHLRYWGYVGISIYHNATYIALKPIAILLFYVSAVDLSAPYR